MNKRLSETFKVLRFPLAFLIVLKHYYTQDISAEHFFQATGENYNLYGILGDFSADVFPAFVVPLFFFISGYLYFTNMSLETTGRGICDVWKQKTKNRIKSLLIPYISWNLIVLILFHIMQTMTNNAAAMQKEGYILISDYQFIDYLKAFWSIESTGMPIDGPLWFIRDLFVVSVIFTPFIYYGLRYLKIFLLILLFVCLCMSWSIPFAGFGTPWLFWFSFGAYFSLNNKNLGVFCSKTTKILCTIAIIISLIGFVSLYFSKNNYVDIAKLIYVFICVMAVFPCIGGFVENKFNTFAFLSTTSFFLFAIHKPLQVIVRRSVFLLFNPTNELILALLVLMVPIIVTIISLCIYFFIKKYMPYMKFLNGFRL